MKKALLIAGGAGLLASGLAWYFFSRRQEDCPQNSTPDDHSDQIDGEKKFRRAMRKSKQHSVANE